MLIKTLNFHTRWVALLISNAGLSGKGLVEHVSKCPKKSVSSTYRKQSVYKEPEPFPNGLQDVIEKGTVCQRSLWFHLHWSQMKELFWACWACWRSSETMGFDPGKRSSLRYEWADVRARRKLIKYTEAVFPYSLCSWSQCTRTVTLGWLILSVLNNVQPYNKVFTDFCWLNDWGTAYRKPPLTLWGNVTFTSYWKSFSEQLNLADEPLMIQTLALIT